MELEAIKSIYGEDAIIKASSQAYSLELSVELDERAWYTLAPSGACTFRCCRGAFIILRHLPTY